MEGNRAINSIHNQSGQYFEEKERVMSKIYLHH